MFVPYHKTLKHCKAHKTEMHQQDAYFNVLNLTYLPWRAVQIILVVDGIHHVSVYLISNTDRFKITL